MVQVRITFDVREPETHLVKVTQRFPPTKAASRTFRMAAWVPGSYKIRDYARHVQDLSATVGGRPALVEQVSKDAWSLARTAGKAIELTFWVYGRELGVQNSHITADHAHILPATAVLYDDASRELPHAVSIVAPRGWRTWSGLEGKTLNGQLEPAADYDHLIDCPIEVGPPEDYVVESFVFAGKKHRLVTWRPPEGADWGRLVRDVKAIVAATVKIWGEAPYTHYTFLSHVAAGHGGGLEHRNSTVLGVDPGHLVADAKIQENFLPLVAHEFWHTWNVKRILPAAFQPYDLQHEVSTGLLWLFEGFTSYYELPVLHRAGVVTLESWSKIVQEMVEFLDKAVGRKRISVAQASRLTWTLLYQPHEHNVNRNVSYYTKGLLVGLCLDAELRRRGVKEGLDVVMRHLWRKHGRTDMGLTEDGFADVVEQATGKNLRALLKKWVDGTEELPLERAFRQLGFDLKRDWKDPKRAVGLGIQFKQGAPGGPAVIERIPDDVPAWRVLQPDDELVAVGGYKWSPDRFGEWATNKQPGDRAGVAVFREGRLRVLEVPLTEMAKDKVTVYPRKGPVAKRARLAWLGEGKAKAAKSKASKAKRRPAKRAKPTRPRSSRSRSR